jgi:rhodanese-related sulfurtransferase
MTLADLLAAAAAKIHRCEPREAFAAAAAGALIVDIRSGEARARDGIVPGSVHIPRTVLEWRVAPDSEWRNPHLDGSARLVLLCDHGCSSLLAAASLHDLGFSDVADVIGGFEAWRAAGLPVRAYTAGVDDLPGMRGPDPD